MCPGMGRTALSTSSKESRLEPTSASSESRVADEGPTIFPEPQGREVDGNEVLAVQSGLLPPEGRLPGLRRRRAGVGRAQWVRHSRHVYGLRGGALGFLRTGAIRRGDSATRRRTQGDGTDRGPTRGQGGGAGPSSFLHGDRGPPDAEVPSRVISV